jgi:quercetin dioxygenase-like cupin family protein
MSEDEIKKYWKTTEDANTQSAHNFYPCSEIPTIQPMPGIKMRGVVGQNLMMNYVYFEPNIVVPMHQHEQEQISIVLEGELEFDVEGEVRLVKTGDVLTIPPFAKHGARTYNITCVQIDVFTPPRLYEGAPEIKEVFDRW